MKSKYKCPKCNALMNVYNGNVMTTVGYTLICEEKACPCNENVFGYGTTEAKAYVVACHKYGGKNFKSNESGDE